jgi:hypothetical protein
VSAHPVEHRHGSAASVGDLETVIMTRPEKTEERRGRVRWR